MKKAARFFTSSKHTLRRKKRMFTFVALGLVCALLWIFISRPHADIKSDPWWSVQSIDTVKFSRDLSREKENDISFNSTIDQQVKNIAQTGATHIAIATPYDEEFYPYLRRWVDKARTYGLHVWFRGNFSGWEKWFGYSAITRTEHYEKIEEFILAHKDLFKDGDIFTPCPECENGGPGDPRRTGDVVGFRDFMISEYKMTQDVFGKIGKRVITNYNSMNGDVARLVMDKQTTAAMGGIITIDHYVASPDRLLEDIHAYAIESGGKVVLGEFGAPILDIHGAMTQEQQKEYLETTFSKLATSADVVGINYWTNEGGSTELWRNGIAREAVDAIRMFYSPHTIAGIITDELDKPIDNSSVLSAYKSATTDVSGQFRIVVLPNESTLAIRAVGFRPKISQINKDVSQLSVPLVKEKPGLLFSLLKRLHFLIH